MQDSVADLDGIFPEDSMECTGADSWSSWTTSTDWHEVMWVLPSMTDLSAMICFTVSDDADFEDIIWGTEIERDDGTL